MDISGWFNEEVTVAARTGHDKDGKPLYGTQSIVPVMVERKTKRVRNQTSGEEVISDTQLLSDVEITAESRVWLDGADVTKGNEARTVQAVDSATSRVDGNKIFEVML